MKRLIMLSTASLAFALAACGDAAEEADDPMVDDAAMTEPAATTAMNDYDPMTGTYELGADAQTRRDAFDRASFDTEYSGYRTALQGDPEMGSMTRGSLQYSNLDRNGDGRLTAAEYAIYAAPLDSELNDRQVGTLADSYYYFDTDGDGYLSSSEYDALRTGGNRPGNMSGTQSGQAPGRTTSSAPATTGTTTTTTTTGGNMSSTQSGQQPPAN